MKLTSHSLICISSRMRQAPDPLRFMCPLLDRYRGSHQRSLGHFRCKVAHPALILQELDMYRRLSGSGANLPLASVEEGDESRGGGAQSPVGLILPTPAGGSGGGGSNSHAALRSEKRRPTCGVVAQGSCSAALHHARHLT